MLGQELPTDAVVSQAINVVGGGSIDPSQVDITKIPLPATAADRRPITAR